MPEANTGATNKPIAIQCRTVGLLGVGRPHPGISPLHEEAVSFTLYGNEFLLCSFTGRNSVLIIHDISSKCCSP